MAAAGSQAIEVLSPTALDWSTTQKFVELLCTLVCGARLQLNLAWPRLAHPQWFSSLTMPFVTFISSAVLNQSNSHLKNEAAFNTAFDSKPFGQNALADCKDCLCLSSKAIDLGLVPVLANYCQ